MSKGNRLLLDDLAVGDVVQIRTTREVVKVGGNAWEDKPYDGCVVLADVQNGAEITLGAFQDYGSLRIDMVKKAAKPKPKAGDVIDGGDLSHVPWEPGTAFLVTFHDKTTVWVRTKNEEWQSHDGRVVGSGAFWKGDRLTLLHVA